MKNIFRYNNINKNVPVIIYYRLSYHLSASQTHIHKYTHISPAKVSSLPCFFNRVSDIIRTAGEFE